MIEKKILLIDDDDPFRSLLRRKLEKEGYLVVEASDGQQGIVLFKSDPPDLVITDIVMPVQEGMETIYQMKNTTEKVPIIAISGGGRIHADDYLPMACGIGAEMSFKKPFDWEDFLSAVRSCLSRKDE